MAQLVQGNACLRHAIARAAGQGQRVEQRAEVEVVCGVEGVGGVAGATDPEAVFAVECYALPVDDGGFGDGEELLGDEFAGLSGGGLEVHLKAVVR